MQLFSQESFFEELPSKMFYVGFLKSAQAWFPLCVVSQPETRERFDTLLISPTLQAMDETVKTYARQISQVEDTFVQYLNLEEIKNLVGHYALDQVAIVEAEVDLGGACGCGCGCE